MAQRVNKVTLVGFLGATPELKFTAQGRAVATLSLAVNLPAPANAASRTSENGRFDDRGAGVPANARGPGESL